VGEIEKDRHRIPHKKKVGKNVKQKRSIKRGVMKTIHFVERSTGRSKRYVQEKGLVKGGT